MRFLETIKFHNKMCSQFAWFTWVSKCSLIIQLFKLMFIFNTFVLFTTFRFFSKFFYSILFNWMLKIFESGIVILRLFEIAYIITVYQTLLKMITWIIGAIDIFIKAYMFHIFVGKTWFNNLCLIRLRICSKL